MNRIDATFKSLKKQRRKAFMPFIAAGDPGLEATAAILRAIQARGVADLVELGVPYSDPIADGPVIQASYQRALAAGVTPQGILDLVGRLRSEGLALPVCLMVSYALVYRPGVEDFVARAAAAGIDGLIVPDLPADEAEPLAAALAERGLAYVPLIAPTTSAARRQQIVARATGFIYCISVAGITGERTALPAQLADYVKGIKKAARVPVCVGFGVSRPEHVEAVAQVADGAIVGSAIVHRIADHSADPPEKIAQVVADFCAELAAPLRR
ncbi:MAG: tryptophan synthase subunit alpha [Planctomycetes bacterium]|nr:tryptophan synthase subunit alpha [Planctomycetota bacterium]